MRLIRNTYISPEQLLWWFPSCFSQLMSSDPPRLESSSSLLVLADIQTDMLKNREQPWISHSGILGSLLYRPDFRENIVQGTWLNKTVQTDREWSTHFHKEWEWPRIISIHGCPAQRSCLGFASEGWDAPELQWNPCGSGLSKHQTSLQITLINTFFAWN